MAWRSRRIDKIALCINGGFIFTFFGKTNSPTSSLGGLVGQKSIPTFVDVLVVSMAGRRRTSGRVNMTRPLVLAGGAVMIGGNTVPVHGAGAAGGPFAFDGSTELCYELGIGWGGCRGRRSSSGGDELFNAGNFLGGELREGLVARNKVVEHSLFVGGYEG
jgi:hypothetical protein